MKGSAKRCRLKMNGPLNLRFEHVGKELAKPVICGHTAIDAQFGRGCAAI